MTQLIIPNTSQITWKSPAYNNKNSYYDVIFATENNKDKIYAHRCILQFNEYFKTLFTTNMRAGKEVDTESNAEIISIDDTSLIAIDILLRSIYEGKQLDLSNISLNDFYSLTYLANEWIMADIKIQLFIYLQEHIYRFLDNDISCLEWLDIYYSDMKDTPYTLIDYKISPYGNRYKNVWNGQNLFKKCEEYVNKNIQKTIPEMITWHIFNKFNQTTRCQIYITNNMFEKLSTIDDTETNRNFHLYIVKNYNRYSDILTLEQFNELKTCSHVIKNDNMITSLLDRNFNPIRIISFKPFHFIKYTMLGQIGINNNKIEVDSKSNFKKGDTIRFSEKEYKIDKIYWYGKEVNEGCRDEIFHITLQDQTKLPIIKYKVAYKITVL